MNAMSIGRRTASRCECREGAGGRLRVLTNGESLLDICLPGVGVGSRQAGQSLVEALVGIVALAGLFVLIPVLGRYQDLGLQTMHAASSVALATVRGVPEPQRAAAHPFADAARRWTDRSGLAMLPADGSGLGAVATIADDAAAAWQIGGSHAGARQLRQEWSLDGGIVTAQVRTSPAAGTGAAGTPSGGGGMRWNGALTPPIHRRVAILAGSGHAGGDAAAQSRMASSRSAWSDDATQSVRAGRAAATVLQPLDAGWQRPAPDFDWLSAWSGLVPPEAVAP